MFYKNYVCFKKQRLVHEDLNIAEGKPTGFHPINNFQTGVCNFNCWAISKPMHAHSATGAT